MSLKIKPVLCRAGIMDNYAYILQDEQSGTAAVVDASEAAPIMACCEKLNIKPAFVLTTHHHFDHVGGNELLKKTFGLKIVGPAAEADKIPELDIGLSDGETFSLGESEAKIISAPGHTLGHILWYFAQAKALFTGDVLFNLSIGGLFEGTALQMKKSLQKIMALPDTTLFYPGHEYTLYGLQQACALSDHAAIHQYAALAKERLKKGEPVGPISLALEKQCNPYLLNLDKL